MGRIVEAARAHGLPATGADIVDRSFGFMVQDFALATEPVDNIVTNPPFALARQFVDHALELARHLKIFVRFSLRFAACTIKHHGQQRGATMGCRRLAPRFWPWSIQRCLLPV
jgi:predicted RNA methylase